MGPIEPYSLPPMKPYSLPSVETEGPRVLQGWELEKLVNGQGLLNRATLVSFLFMILHAVGYAVACASNTPIEDGRLDLLTTAMSICLLIGYGVTVTMGIAGFLRVESGLRMHPIFRIVLIPAIVIPSINLFTLMVLNSLASDALRAVGYRINFLGVAKWSSIKRPSSSDSLPLLVDPLE